MLVVHHLNNSRSFRILWLCEELGLEYDVVKHFRDPQTKRSPDSLKQVHPLGKAPVVELNGELIAETDAVIETICHRCGDGRLSRTPEAADYPVYRQWLSYPEGTLMPGLVTDLIYDLTGGGNDVFKSVYDRETFNNLKHLENSLQPSGFLLATGFSAADINTGWTLAFAEARGKLENFQGLIDYLARLRGRDAWQRAMDRGGPQDLSGFS